MTSYYMMECFAPNNARTYQNILSYPYIDGIDSWILGSKFKITPPNPLILSWQPNTGGSKKKFYDSTIPLMHKSLHSCLISFGIDNIDIYPVQIIDPESNVTDYDYYAINIIGAVAAANLGESKYTDHTGRGLIDLDIDQLIISEEATLWLPFFRLAECVSGIVVSEKIKEGLEKNGGFGLSFIEPINWIG